MTKENFNLVKSKCQECKTCYHELICATEPPCSRCKVLCSAIGDGTGFDSWVAKLGKPFVAPAPEMVNHPAHYNTGKIEVIDAIEDWRLGFNSGNAVKYISRADHKGKKLEDLRKAAWYLQREIDNENSKSEL